jgi:peptidoglycan/xylan/chitin deacetylase (PgdA/CDA1 family)
MLHRTPFVLPLLFPNLIWRIPTSEKKLFLTFDDGPVPGPTEMVLNTLAANQIPATFFCIGDNVRKHPELFQRIQTEGHTVANHTRHHLNGWKTPLADYLANVHACDEDLGRPATFFRPPYGRITRNQVRHLASKQIIMWDVLTRDYDRSLSPTACLSGSLRALRPGSIIVFHDSLKAEKNLSYALPRLLDAARQRGYSFGLLEPKLEQVDG